MTRRAVFSIDGVRVSRAGYDAMTASVDNLGMYPGMSTMTMAVQGTVTLAGGSRQTYTFSNPTGRMPYVILSSTAGDPPDRQTFCAETFPPFNTVYIRNDVQTGAPTRTIRFAVLIDNSFI